MTHWHYISMAYGAFAVLMLWDYLVPRLALKRGIRQLQLKQLRPDLVLKDLRGNINTRLAKCQNGEYDAIILACAGLERLDMQAQIRSVLAPPQWWPAVAQGAIAIEIRRNQPQLKALFAALNHPETECCVRAERAMNKALHGSCHVPVAAYATLNGESLSLSGWVGDANHGRPISAQATGKAAQPELLGEAVAEQLFGQGAAALLGLA